MMYHSLSFLQQHFHVTLIGYPGSPLLPSLLSHPAFEAVFLPLPWATPRWAFVLAGPAKVVWQSVVVLWTLMRLRDPPEFILVQVRSLRHLFLTVIWPSAVLETFEPSPPPLMLTAHSPPFLVALRPESTFDPHPRSRSTDMPLPRLQTHRRLAQLGLFDPRAQAR